MDRRFLITLFVGGILSGVLGWIHVRVDLGEWGLMLSLFAIIWVVGFLGMEADWSRVRARLTRRTHHGTHHSG